MNRQRLKALLAQYGRVAVGTYFGIFALTLTGFAAAISMGFNVSGASGTAGLLGAAWVATKLTQPLRIVGTVVLTPLVSAALTRLGWERTAKPPEPGPSSQT